MKRLREKFKNTELAPKNVPFGCNKNAPEKSKQSLLLTHFLMSVNFIASTILEKPNKPI